MEPATKTYTTDAPDCDEEAVLTDLTDIGCDLEYQLGDTVPVCDPQAGNFYRTEHLAKDLLIARMARAAGSYATRNSKLEALACFWIAANFQTVGDAIAHTFGDDPLPVGETLGEFVKSFLGEEKYNEIVWA